MAGGQFKIAVSPGKNLRRDLLRIFYRTRFFAGNGFGTPRMFRCSSAALYIVTSGNAESIEAPRRKRI